MFRCAGQVQSDISRLDSKQVRGFSSSSPHNVVIVLSDIVLVVDHVPHVSITQSTTSFETRAAEIPFTSSWQPPSAVLPSPDVHQSATTVAPKYSWQAGYTVPAPVFNPNPNTMPVPPTNIRRISVQPVDNTGARQSGHNNTLHLNTSSAETFQRRLQLEQELTDGKVSARYASEFRSPLRVDNLSDNDCYCCHSCIALLLQSSGHKPLTTKIRSQQAELMRSALRCVPRCKRYIELYRRRFV